MESGGAADRNQEADEEQVYGKDDEAALLFNIQTDRWVYTYCLLVCAFVNKSRDL